MATSGSFRRDYNVGGLTPSLTLRWEVEEVDVQSNRSKLKLELVFQNHGAGYFSYHTPFWVHLHGEGIALGSKHYTQSIGGGSPITLHTRVVWVTHDFDGTKSQYLRGDISILDGVVSGYANLDPITRMSFIDDFSIANHLKPSTANTINLTLNRPSTSYRHDIELRDGSFVLQSWSNQINPSTLTISSATVNTLLSRMSSSNTKVVTLRVTSKLNGDVVGTPVSANAIATVHDDNKPTVSGLSITVSGTGFDNTMGLFVQGISKANFSFNSTAVAGATITSNSITIRKVTGGGNSQTLNGKTGTTGNVLSLNGLYEAIATAVDSRGQVGTQRVPFTVSAYSPPNISSFTAVRNPTTPATVILAHAGSWSRFAGGGQTNSLTVRLDRRVTGGSWSLVNSTTLTTTSGTFTRSVNSTSTSVTNSYEFRLTITDSFGNVSTSLATVSTQNVLFDFYKDIGIGIGKMWQQGILDITGDVYINGVKLGGEVEYMPISGGVLENYREKLVVMAASTNTINLNLGNVFEQTPSGNRSYIFNSAGTGAHSFTLRINIGSIARSISFPSSVKWKYGEVPDLSTTNKSYLLTFLSTNGGSEWLGMDGGMY